MVTISAQAQNLFIGVRAGANFTNVNAKHFDDNVTRKGISTGLTFDYVFRNKIILSADILYSQKGFGNYFIFGDPLRITGATSSGGRQVVYFHYDYLSVPLKIGYTIGQTFFGFGNLGLIPSYLVNANTKLSDAPTIDATGDVTKFDLAGQIELGCGYRIRESYFIYTSASFANSFTYLSNDNYFSGSDISHYGITLSLGFKYKWMN